MLAENQIRFNGCEQIGRSPIFFYLLKKEEKQQDDYTEVVQTQISVFKLKK